jgi:hypothetical protein
MNLVDFEDLPMILPSVQYHQHIKLQKASGIKTSWISISLGSKGLNSPYSRPRKQVKQVN